jgi:glycerophosphoryl diester phosphodiesterase
LEWVLHRSNTAERVRQGVAAGFDRLEMDVWCKRGELRLSHDPSVGRVVLGPNGVALDEKNGRRWLSVVRRVDAHLTLPEVVEGIRDLPPLLLDLKGRWPDRGLERLATLRAGHPDAVCSPDAGIVRRYSMLRPEVLPMYADRHVQGGEVRPEARGEERPVAVSARAATLLGPGGEGLLEQWRDAGLRVYVWDVPDAAVLRRMIGMGVDGAIVREPAWIREVAA